MYRGPASAIGAGRPRLCHRRDPNRGCSAAPHHRTITIADCAAGSVCAAVGSPGEEESVDGRRVHGGAPSPRPRPGTIYPAAPPRRRVGNAGPRLLPARRSLRALARGGARSFDAAQAGTARRRPRPAHRRRRDGAEGGRRRRGHHNRGLGKRLLAAVLADLRERGVRRVVVGTSNAGIGQFAFYQKAGFRFWRIERDFFTPARGYDPDARENGIAHRDMVWFDQDLT